MRVYSWNVNGMRAVLGKGFGNWLEGSDADVVLLQEVKAEPAQLPPEWLSPLGYASWWSPTKARKGHSGVGAYSRVKPLSVTLDPPVPELQGEGRIIRLEFEDFFLFNVYFPNGQSGPERLAYKLAFYESFLAHVQELRRDKPVVVGGDFNTAHTELDLKRPLENLGTSGFLPEERAWLDAYVASGFRDTFRMFEKGGGHYTWWSPFRNARARNSGWRIDGFLVSEELAPRVARAWIEPQVMGSDHCPVGLELL